MKETMKRKYVTPEMEEMEFDLEIQLLVGSDPNTIEQSDDYEDGGDPFSN